MTMMEDAQIEALKCQFEEDRARVWADPRIPHGQKQAEVDRLWREFDRQRTELREALAQGYVPAGTSRRPVSPITGNPMIFPRKRRPYWK
jgi:hypothetical protein